MTGAERIADFAATLAFDGIPDAVRAAAGLHFMDAIGVGIAAAAGGDQQRWSGAASGPGSACLLGGGTATAAEAALFNGALIHSLEYDDTHLASVVHGSAVAAPAALAVAQDIDATGADLLTAYVIAWEVMVRIGLSMPGAFQARGVQVTAVAGAIGAAAAVGRLRGLDAGALTSAIGLAGGQASGLLAFLEDGSTAKALNPGWAAHTGVTAAGLARAGMTGPARILESRFGAMEVFAGGSGTLEAQLSDLGRRWHLPDAAFKLYPCCHYIHPFLEAVESLLADGLDADAIAAIGVRVAPGQAPLICEPWRRRQSPYSGYDGKWGLAYCIGLLLAEGGVDIGSFDTPPRPEAVAQARKISWEPMENADFPARFPAWVQVTLTDGSVRTASVDTVLGSPARPIGRETVTAKFRKNAARRFGPEQVDGLERALDELPASSSMCGLTKALTPVGHRP